MNFLQNLNEIDIVQKKQADGSYGSSYTVKKHNPDRGQKLIKKDASKDDIEKVKKDKEEDKPEKIKSGEPNQKDKSLKQNVETSKSETYSTTDTGIDDKEFSNQPEIEPVFENESDELRTEDIEKFFESGRIPKNMLKLLHVY